MLLDKDLSKKEDSLVLIWKYVSEKGMSFTNFWKKFWHFWQLFCEKSFHALRNQSLKLNFFGGFDQKVISDNGIILSRPTPIWAQMLWIQICLHFNAPLKNLIDNIILVKM